MNIAFELFKLQVQMNWLSAQIYHLENRNGIIDGKYSGSDCEEKRNKWQLVMLSMSIFRYDEYIPATSWYFMSLMSFFNSSTKLNLEKINKEILTLTKKQEELIVRYAYSQTQKINHSHSSNISLIT